MDSNEDNAPTSQVWLHADTNPKHGDSFNEIDKEPSWNKIVPSQFGHITK